MEINETVINLGTLLTELMVKNTIKTIDERIQAVKLSKDKEKIHAGYQEIINELLNEKEEAIRIAQAYKIELDRVEISEQDIEHLHNTITKLLEVLLKLGVMNGEEKDENSELFASIDQIKELVSVDTLKTMQLLGFNYKAAIGEPLTELVADKISSYNKGKPTNNTNKRKK